MKNCIKFLSLFMSIIMMMAIVGCGKKTGKTDTNDDFFTDAESQTVQSGSTESPNSSDTKGNVEVGGKSWEMLLKSMPKNLRGTTVTVVNWNPMSEYTGATTAIKTFEKQTGIKVDWQTVDYGVYLTRLATMVASGKSPDVVRTRTPDPAWLQSFQSLDAAQYDFSDDAWDKTLMKDYTVKGVTYATSLNNTHLGSVTLLFYNKDLISKYDYEDPYKLWKSGKWTMNKFIEMCRQYKKDAKDSFPCTGGYWETWTEIYGVEGPVGYDGTKYYSNLSNSKFLTVTQNVADLYNKDQLLFPGRAEKFNSGSALFYAGGSVYLRRNNSYFESLKSAGTLYVVPMPSVDGQDTYYQGKDEYEAYAIAKGAKNPTAVPYFLRYFLDANNYDINSFFCNKQNLEVYRWCMSQKNTIWSTYFESKEDKFATGEEGSITVLQGNQIKSFIDANSGIIDTRVKNFNDLVSQLK